MRKKHSLTPQQQSILIDKATEPAFSGKSFKGRGEGSFICRGCGLPLFRADAKFTSQCGWPSFDESIKSNVTEVQDADGIRTEIICYQCHGHLGHVFDGEGFSHKNRRHCVNSIAVEFVSSNDVKETDEVVIAGGCFWGVEYLLNQHPAVLLTEVGYTGGQTHAPSYQSICRGDTGHYEAVRVVFDPALSNAEALYQLFFQIHDPFQADGQGADKGLQYQSAIFVYDEDQQKQAEKCITFLEEKYHQEIATKLYPVSTFWPAEEDHQAYYQKNGNQPYCYRFTPRF